MKEFFKKIWNWIWLSIGFILIITLAWVSYAWIWLQAENWDNLTSWKWNELVNYIDNQVAAAWNVWYIDWNDCEYKYWAANLGTNNTISCTTWYTLVDHSCSVNWSYYSSRSRWICYLNWINSLYLNTDWNNAAWPTYGSLKCCKYIAP